MAISELLTTYYTGFAAADGSRENREPRLEHLAETLGHLGHFTKYNIGPLHATIKHILESTIPRVEAPIFPQPKVRILASRAADFSGLEV